MAQDKVPILVIIQRDLTHGNVGVILATRDRSVGDPGGRPPPFLLRTVIVDVYAFFLDKLGCCLNYWFGSYSFHERVQ